jgi:hypothetical protein
MSLAEIPNPTEPTPQQVRFHQIKGNFFRAIHADGAWISVHPNEFVHLTFYNERTPIATEVVHNLTDAGQLTTEDRTKRVTRKGFVRELEVDVILNRATAQALHAWLDNYIKGALPKEKAELI